MQWKWRSKRTVVSKPPKKVESQEDTLQSSASLSVLVEAAGKVELGIFLVEENRCLFFKHMAVLTCFKLLKWPIVMEALLRLLH